MTSMAPISPCCRSGSRRSGKLGFRPCGHLHEAEMVFQESLDRPDDVGFDRPLDLPIRSHMLVVEGDAEQSVPDQLHFSHADHHDLGGAEVDQSVHEADGFHVSPPHVGPDLQASGYLFRRLKRGTSSTSRHSFTQQVNAGSPSSLELTGANS